MIAIRPKHRNSDKAAAARRCEAHLQWIRGRECMCANHGNCEGRIEAAHVDYAGGKGMAIKVSDAQAVPLCSLHHRLSHTLGRKTFEARYAVNMLTAAAVYAKASPHWARLHEMV